MTIIKICGITSERDAVNALSAGADILGFVFYPGSKRYVSFEKAASIIKELPASVLKAGVFVDSEKETALEAVKRCALDLAQFHGSERADYCRSFSGICKVIKAFRLYPAVDLKIVNDFDVDFLLLDTYKEGLPGGTGEAFDWGILEGFKFQHPVILSGGLNARNVGEAIRKVRPYAVDVSSGVEDSPGIKNFQYMVSFVDSVRKAYDVT